jgi:GTP-sensing pleiotropic transcriptional regulator CodY
MLQFINDHKEIIIGVIVVSATIFTAGHIIGYAGALYDIQNKVITLNTAMNKLDNEYSEILLTLYPTEANRSTAAYAQFYDIATQITDCGVQVVSLITT